MSYEVTDAELRRFMESNPKYAKYRDNLALARILYAKHIGAIAAGMPQANSDRLYLFKGMRVKIRGIVAGYVVQEYDACVKCLRAKRKCVCGASEVVKRYVVVYTIGDNFGNVEAVSWDTMVDEKKLDELVGAEVEAIGRVEEDEDGFKLVSVSLRVLSTSQSKETDDGIASMLQILSEAKYMRIDVFEALAKERGVDVEQVLKRVEVRDGYVYPKKD
ncbi:MAG: hypothetical protein QXN23_05805 [Candidatus Caldarchaeum sp.]